MHCWSSLCVPVLVGLLVACGGGGGDGSSGGSAPPASSGSDPPSGLLPAAPRLGPVLYADATELRPVTAGAVWAYRRALPNRFGSDRASTILFTDASGQTYSEVDDDDWDTPTTLTVVPGQGIRSSTLVTVPRDQYYPFMRDVDHLFNAVSSAYPSLRQNVAFTLSGFELKSPVQTGDREVLLDALDPDSGLDVDGDGRADAVRVAVWREVVGVEAAELPDGTRFPDAVRVDLRLSARFVHSGGTTAPAIDRQISTWYVPGIGAVRSAVTGPSGIVPGLFDEWLTGFDGRTRGWRGLVLPPAVVRAYTPDPTPDTGGVWAAVPRPDGALVFTGTQVVRLGKDGRIISSIPASQSCSGLPDLTPVTVVSAFVGYACVMTNARQTDMVLSVYALDDNGALRGQSPTARIDLAGAAHQASNAGFGIYASPEHGRFWVSYSSQDGSVTFIPARYYVQGFDGNGAAQTARIQYHDDAIGRGQSSAARPTAEGGVAVTVTYCPGANSCPSVHKVFSAQGAQVWTMSSDTGGTFAPYYDIVSGDDGAWFIARTTSATAPTTFQAVRYDHSFGGGGSGSISATSDPGMDPVFFQSNLLGWLAFAAHDGRLHGLVHAYSSVTEYLAYGEFDGGSLHPNTGFRQTRHLEFFGLRQPPSNMVKPLFFDDRIIYLTHSANMLTPIVIWR